MRLAHWIRFLAIVSWSGVNLLVAQPPCAPQWTAGIQSVPGVLGEVMAAAIFDDGGGPKIYIGGRLDLAGQAIATNLATWDGTRFASIAGCPMAEVRVLAVHDDGAGNALYAAGADAGWQVMIARYRSGVWTVIAPPTWWSITALKSFDSGSGPRLYAAGAFSQLGGAAAAGIASWNGSTWTAASNPATSSADPEFRALEVHDDGSGPALYAAGAFSMIDGVAVSNVARFDGSAWSAVGAGSAGVPVAMVSSPSGLHVAGGSATAPPSAGNSFFMRWTGTQWAALPSPGIVASECFTMFDSGSGPELIAGDGYGGGFFRWDGAAWNAMSASGTSPVNPRGLVSCDFGAGPSLYVGGSFPNYVLPNVEGFGKLVGSSWRPLVPQTGVNGPIVSLGMADDGTGPALYAAGDFLAADGIPARRVARWNGSFWSPVGAGLPGIANAFQGFDDGTGPKVYAAVYAPFTPYLSPQVWNGSSWSSTPLALGLGFNATSLSVFDDGAGPRLYATGNLVGAALGGLSPHVCRLDAATWTPVGGGLASTSAYESAFCSRVFDDGSGPTLYAGGRFSPAAPGVARWNGSVWTMMGSGLAGPAAADRVMCLQEFDDGSGPTLFAGGRFSVGWSQALARWNGTSWVAALPGMIRGTVQSLAVYDDGRGPALYLSGPFQYIPPSGAPIASMLRYSRGSVEAVAGGFGPPGPFELPIGAVLCSGTGPLSGRLYAGGGFLQAGGTFSPYFAEFAPVARPLLTLSQPGGAGSGVEVLDSNLVNGFEYFNVFSAEPSPGGAGTGPFLGLTASNPASLIQQVLLPLGTAPFHFGANGNNALFGPYALPAGLTIDAICLTAPPGNPVCASPVARWTTY